MLLPIVNYPSVVFHILVAQNKQISKMKQTKSRTQNRSKQAHSRVFPTSAHNPNILTRKPCLHYHQSNILF